MTMLKRLRERLAFKVSMLRLALRARAIAGGDGGGEPSGDPPKDPPARAFSETDVERIVKERLARDRRERPSDEEISALRESERKLKELEAANESELERAQARATEAEKKAKEVEEAAAKKANEATENAQKVIRRAEVIAEATKAGAVNAEAVHDLLAARGFKAKDGDEKELSVTVGDDGRVTGVQETVKALLESEKYLVGETPDPGPSDGGARTPATGPISKERLAGMKPEEIAQLDQKEVDKALAAG